MSTNLAYLAGYFDGEGSICMGSGGRRSTIPQLATQVRSGDKTVLDRFAETFGGTVITPKHRRYKDSWNRKRQIFAWALKGQKAQDFLRQILPFLDTKRHPAELALQVEFFQGSRDPEKKAKRIEIAGLISAFNQRVTVEQPWVM